MMRFLVVVLLLLVCAACVCAHAYDAADICTSQGGMIVDGAVWTGLGPGLGGHQIGDIVQTCIIPDPGTAGHPILLSTLASPNPTMAKLVWDARVQPPNSTFTKIGSTPAKDYCAFVGGLTAGNTVGDIYNWYQHTNGTWDDGQWDVCVFADRSGLGEWTLFYHNIGTDPILDAVKWGWNQ